MVWQKKDRIYLTQGGTKICIQGTRVRFNYNRMLVKLNIPKTGAEDEPQKLVLDFNKVDELLTLDGILATTTSEMSDQDVSSAETKRANLAAFSKRKGVVAVNWRDTSLGDYYIEKSEVTDNIKYEMSGDPLQYKCIIALVKGVAP